MNQEFYDAVEESPVIAAVKDQEGLSLSCRMEEIKVIFVLFGDICTIGEIVHQIKEAGKMAVVHMDLIGGLVPKEIAVEYMKHHAMADGIITTRPQLIKRAKELGLFTILRFFLIDSMALANVEKQYLAVKPDFIELLPGLMPKMIRKICEHSNIPIIAGGLITDKEDVMAALSAGAISVSTTNQKVWLM